MSEFETQLLLQNVQLIVDQFTKMSSVMEVQKKQIEKNQKLIISLKQEIKILRNPLPEFLSARQVCKQLAVTHEHFTSLIAEGILRGSKQGKNWKIHKDELERYQEYVQKI